MNCAMPGLENPCTINPVTTTGQIDIYNADSIIRPLSLNIWINPFVFPGCVLHKAVSHGCSKHYCQLHG